MKRVKINELHFKSLIDGVKHCVSKEGYSHILEYIQIKVKPDTITAYAIDGYRAGRVEIKNTFPIDEEFTCYIKPLSVKVSKSGINQVVIECTGENTFVEVISEHGILRYDFPVPSGEFFDVENLYKKFRQNDREISFQTSYVVEALKALNGINHIRGGSYAVLGITENNKQPFIIRAKNDSIVNEQIILPEIIK